MNQFSLIFAENIAGLQSPMLQKIRNPFYILYIGLTSQNISHILGIHHHNISIRYLKNVVQCLLVKAGSLYGDPFTAILFKPVR